MGHEAENRNAVLAGGGRDRGIDVGVVIHPHILGAHSL